MPTVPAQPPTTITRWSPPTWADQITDDGDLIEAFTVLGSIPQAPSTGPDTLSVIVMQRDEIDCGTADYVVKRHPAEILIGGVSLSPTQAGDLAELINSAISLIAVNEHPRP